MRVLACVFPSPCRTNPYALHADDRARDPRDVFGCVQVDVLPAHSDGLAERVESAGTAVRHFALQLHADSTCADPSDHSERTPGFRRARTPCTRSSYGASNEASGMT